HTHTYLIRPVLALNHDPLRNCRRPHQVLGDSNERRHPCPVQNHRRSRLGVPSQGGSDLQSCASTPSVCRCHSRHVANVLQQRPWQPCRKYHPTYLQLHGRIHLQIHYQLRVVVQHLRILLHPL